MSRVNGYSGLNHNTVWQVARETVVICVLMLLSVYVVYFSSPDIAKVLFLLFLALFLVSRKDYFWFAFFFVIIAQPGWLFSDFSGASTTRLPLYTFFAGISLTPIDLFFVLALVKALFSGKGVKIGLSKPLMAILVYGVLLLGLSVVVYGVSLDIFLFLLRNVFTYSAIFSFIYLVNSKESVLRFIWLSFPFVLFILFTQLYFLMTGGHEFINLLSHGYRLTTMTETGAIRPVMGGVEVLFFAYVFSLVLLQGNPGTLARYYLWTVFALCFIAVYLSATRIWVVIFSLILLGFFLFTRINVKRYLQFSVIVVLLIVLLTNFAPFKSGVTSSWERVSQIESVARGRYNEASTFDRRLTSRLPRLLAAFKQNWIFGWGFSDMYMEYQDQHVGNFNLLLQVGVVGFFVFTYFWVSYFRMIFKTRKKLRIGNPYRNSLLVLVYVFVAMLVAHFTTFTFFGYTIGVPGALFVSIFIAMSEYLVREASRSELVMHIA